MEKENPGVSGPMIVAVANAVDDKQVVTVRNWLRSLMEIADSPVGGLAKVRSAYAVTLKAEVIWPVVKLISSHIKQAAWTRQSPKTKWMMAAAATSLVVFPGASAGIAALGGAIGVPLWIVMGAGAGFAQTLYSELGYRLTRNKDADSL